MFVRVAGPTALRLDLVWALVLSLDPGEAPGPEGAEPARAGLVATWDDTQGAVVILIRGSGTHALNRYAFSQRLTTSDELSHAIDRGFQFLEEMGFQLDEPAFRTLSDDQRQVRVAAWDRLRRESGEAPAMDPGPEKKTHEKLELGRISLVKRQASAVAKSGTRLRTLS